MGYQPIAPRSETTSFQILWGLYDRMIVGRIVYQRWLWGAFKRISRLPEPPKPPEPVNWTSGTGPRVRPPPTTLPGPGRSLWERSIELLGEDDRTELESLMEDD
jgi:hypothetical protein